MGHKFVETRAKFYEEALIEYPLARKMDIKIMYQLLDPKPGEYVLGVGEGNGYFFEAIAEAIGTRGKYLVTDPSQELLKKIKSNKYFSQVDVWREEAENLKLAPESYDKAWSFGAFHHLKNQSQAIKNIYNSLVSGGLVVVCDVFQGSALARFFDLQVNQYCETGHEVKFLSREFAKSICYVAGFNQENVSIFHLPQKWYFDSEIELGRFVYKLLAMTKLPGEEKEKVRKVVELCKEYLGVSYNQKQYELNWPMEALVARKC